MKDIYLFIKRHGRLSIAVLLLLDLLFFSLTNPTGQHIYVMVIAFWLIFMTTFVVCRGFLKLMSRLGYINNGKKWLNLVIALAVFLLIIMQSVGQLSFKDILALIPIVVVGYFYYTYTSGSKQTK